MKPLDENAQTRVYDAAGVAGDWFGKLDPHEAGFISGTLGGISKPRVSTGKPVEAMADYLAGKYIEEKKPGRMHGNVRNGLRQMAEELTITTAYEAAVTKRAKRKTLGCCALRRNYRGATPF